MHQKTLRINHDIPGLPTGRLWIWAGYLRLLDKIPMFVSFLYHWTLVLLDQQLPNHPTMRFNRNPEWALGRHTILSVQVLCLLSGSKCPSPTSDSTTMWGCSWRHFESFYDSLLFCVLSVAPQIFQCFIRLLLSRARLHNRNRQWWLLHWNMRWQSDKSFPGKPKAFEQSLTAVV